MKHFQYLLFIPAIPLVPVSDTRGLAYAGRDTNQEVYHTIRRTYLNCGKENPAFSAELLR